MSARFKVDARGNLTAETPEAQAALGSRAGAFFLAPTSPDLLCFVRTPARGGRISAPRVVLAGDASGFPIADLIAFLSQSRWSGVLRLQSPAGERTLNLKDGEVRGATSDDPADRLGEVLVRLGYVDRPRLEETLREHPPSRVGRALVERGLLQPHDLWKCLTHQVSEIFHAIVLSREGAFMLVDQELDDRQGHNLQVSTQSLLMDSITKIDEMAHFRKKIPHGRVFLIRKQAPDAPLEGDEARVLELINGERTVLELGQAAKLSEFDVTKVLFGLIDHGYAALSERAMTPSAPLPSIAAQLAAAQLAAAQAAPVPHVPAAARGHDPHQVIRVFNRIFQEIRDEVAKQGMESEFVAAANAALAGEALSASPVLAGLAFDGTGSLPEEKVQGQYASAKDGALGPEPLTALKKALSDVMFFLLFQAGELLESRADEDLARRVKALLATLEAE